MKGPKIAIVASRFNQKVTDRLLESCLRILSEHGFGESRVFVARVPGAFEIPWTAQELALSGKFGAIIALGAVIRGQTAQNDYIARSVIEQLHVVSIITRVPCLLGVIAPNNEAQALARTRGSLDRGKEAALAAIEILALKLPTHHGKT